MNISRVSHIIILKLLALTFQTPTNGGRGRATASLGSLSRLYFLHFMRSRWSSLTSGSLSGLAGSL